MHGGTTAGRCEAHKSASRRWSASSWLPERGTMPGGLRDIQRSLGGLLRRATGEANGEEASLSIHRRLQSKTTATKGHLLDPCDVCCVW